MSNLLKIYHKLPYPLRVIVASAKGYQLRRWRYGIKTEKLVEEILTQESWSLERWKVWQEERLAYILKRAATQVPYYQKQWNERRRNGDKASYEYLENWPILKKTVLRENLDAFIAEDCNKDKMFCDHTSGTTGTPLLVYSSKETVIKQYAIFEARVRHWHQVSIKERWAILGGQLVVPFEQTKPPFWVFNAGLNQLYLSTHHVSIQNAKAYMTALNRHQPTHFIVYPSSAYILATAIQEQDLIPPSSLKVIFSNAEWLSDKQRNVIQEAFKCPVVNTYGMSENVAFATECQAGKMHISPEVGLIEILDEQENVTAAVANIVATGFLNADMPLIRYEVGDRGQQEGNSQCQCGRVLPILNKVEGRANDLIITKDGRSIFWLDPIFHDIPIIEAQIVQTSLEYILIRVVPTPTYIHADGETIIKRLLERVGEMNVELELIEHIPRTANGKFRAIISNVQ